MNNPSFARFMTFLIRVFFVSPGAASRSAHDRARNPSWRVIAAIGVAVPVALTGCGEVIRGERQYGVVIDAHTQQPIEGALVVVIWQASQPRLLDSLPAGAAHVAETFTDARGQFEIPPWGPELTRYHMHSLTIVAAKAGYGSHGNFQDLAPPIVRAGPIRSVALPREGERIDIHDKIRLLPDETAPEALYMRRVSLLEGVLDGATFGADPETRCRIAVRLPRAIAYMQQVKRETGVKLRGRDPEADLSDACATAGPTR